MPNIKRNNRACFDIYDNPCHQNCPNRKPGCHNMDCPSWAAHEKLKASIYNKHKIEISASYSSAKKESLIHRNCQHKKQRGL